MLRLAFILVSLTFVLYQNASAATDCLVRFASLPDGAAERELVTTTYAQLLEKLGGKLTPEALIAMREDPLRAPDAEGDGYALNRKLGEFRELLGKKGWDTAATRDWLRETLEKRATALRATVDNRERARATTETRHLKLPAKYYDVLFSPDGKYALALAEKNITVIDLATGKSREFPKPASLRERSTEGRNVIGFAPDGALMLTGQGLRHFTVPFQNGEILWEKPHDLLGPEAGSTDYTFDHLPLEVPNRVFLGVRQSGDEPLFFLWGNTQTRTVERKPWPAEIPRGVHYKYGPVPGQRRYYYISSEGARSAGQKFRLYMTSYDEKLDFKVEHSQTVFNDLMNHIRISRDGKSLLAIGIGNGENQVQMVPLTGGSPMPLLTKTGSPAFGERIAHSFIHPIRNELLLLHWKRPTPGMKLDIIDLETRRSRQTIDINYHVTSAPFITPDGAFLCLPGTSPGVLTIVPLEARLE